MQKGPRPARMLSLLTALGPTAGAWGVNANISRISSKATDSLFLPWLTISHFDLQRDGKG